ncbi:acyltransferase [Stieleria marina]|uniref:acyltransferase n=1 Tax=Stieleria marina TaxID=1930275 RepID=UPI003AF3F3F7
MFRANIVFHGFENIVLGDDVSINHGCFVSGQGGLTIGDYVAIGHNTSIITTEHTFADAGTPIKYQPVEKRPVSIGSNVWIGANVTILGGVSIANNTIVAAGAVVTKSVEKEFTIIGGVPAKFIKDFSGSASVHAN